MAKEVYVRYYNALPTETSTKVVQIVYTEGIHTALAGEEETFTKQGYKLLYWLCTESSLKNENDQGYYPVNHAIGTKWYESHGVEAGLENPNKILECYAVWGRKQITITYKPLNSSHGSVLQTIKYNEKNLTDPKGTDVQGNILKE